MTQEDREMLNRINDYANEVLDDIDPQKTPVSYQLEKLRPIMQQLAMEKQMSVENIFIKYTTGSYYKDDEPRNAPNIYVVPDDNAENNIKALLEELKQRYGVNEFAPVIVPTIQR